MSKKVLKAIYGSPDKPLVLGDFEIPCYVLENEQRVISQNGMIQALGMSRGSSGGSGGDRLAKFLQGKTIKRFISNDLISVTDSPIKFKTPQGIIAHGYDAETLQGIVRGVSKAYLKGSLQLQQQHIGAKAEQLDDAFSKVGLIALIDEATGYQYVRDRNELHKILKAYISPELMPWAKRFPDEFYEQIFRLNGWQYNPMTPKRPSVIGTWTNKLVYEMLPPGVLAELKAQTPKNKKGRDKHRLHQRLTADIGNPHLERQLAAIIPIMRLSTNWKRFKENFARAFKTGQQAIEFKEDEKKE